MATNQKLSRERIGAILHGHNKKRFKAIGADALAQAGSATRINATGLRLYPGLISANSSLGLIEIAAVRATIDTAEVGAVNPNALAQIALHADNLNGSVASGALLYELILRAGLPPSSRVERIEIAAGGATRDAFAVDGDALLVCVESAMTPALMRMMIARKPKKLVCLDKAFAGDDAAKTNALLEATSHDVMFYTA